MISDKKLALGHNIRNIAYAVSSFYNNDNLHLLWRQQHSQTHRSQNTKNSFS